MQSYALIADPDAAAASLYAAAAWEEGLTYVSVRDGALALAVLAERGTPELLVTEITLPGLADFELIRRVRAGAGGAGTAIIAVSADRTLRERAAELRASLDLGAVLSKATSFESIRRMLRRLRGGARPGGPHSAPAPESARRGPGSSVRARDGSAPTPGRWSRARG